MDGYMAANPKGKHGKHSYTLEEYGLDKAEIEKRFTDYRKRYIV